MVMYQVVNTRRYEVTVNLPDPEKGRLLKTVYLEPRGRLLLSEEEYNSLDIQAKIRAGVLRLEKVQ